MADKKQNLLALLKQIEGTLGAAGLSVVTAKTQNGEEALVTDETRDVLRFQGDNGNVRLEYQNGALEVLAAKDEGDFSTIDTLLFEAEDDSFGTKDIRSAANQVAESISDFFGTTFVPAGATEKSVKSKAAKAAAEKEAAPAAPKKKKNKKSVDSFEPIDLAYRLEAIYPQYAGKADENEAKYGVFLPEEYFQENDVINDILVAIRMEDRSMLKRLFKTFNTYYDDGEKDTQSLIAVTILGIAASKEEGLLSVLENYMDEDLGLAVKGVAKYLSSGAGKRKLKAYNNPKPYKESLRERWGRQGLEQASGQMLDSNSLKK